MVVNSDTSYLEKNISTKLFAEYIIDIIQEPLIVLDVDLRVITVNDSFSNYFNVDPSDAVGNLIYDLNNHEWNIPDLRRLLEDILPESSIIKNYKLKHIFTMENKTLNLNARWFDGKDKNPMILISINDITEDKVTEEKLGESEEKLKTLFENLSVGISVIDDDRKVIYENPALEKILGLSETELKLGKYAERKYFNSDYTEIPSSELPSSKAFDEQKPVKDVEVGVLLDNTTMIWTNVSAIPLSFPDWKMLLVTYDITSHKQVEEKLKESYERFNLAQKVSNIGTFEWNIQRGVNIWTPELEAMYGLKEGEFPGTQEAWEELIHPEDMQKAVGGVEVALKTGEPVESEFRVKWADDSVHWLLGRWQAIKGDDGEPLKLIGINVDITELKKYESKQQNLLKNEKELTSKLHISNQELEKANMELIHQQNVQNKLIQKLEISNKELEQFAYVASHDLQEPLRMVTSFTQLLAMKYRSKLDSDADDYIDFIVEGSHRMKDLIDDLLAYSRLNTEKTEYQFNDLNQIVDKVLLGMKNTLAEENAQITQDKLPTIRCDSSQLGQVFQNLISNSIKFHQTNPKIHISAEETDGKWIVGVSDEGIGISPEYQEQIFDLFKRLHTRKEYPGTGIGLSICKRVVERHNGKIWVESEPGNGSSFYFTLPKQSIKP
jgi:PAS domain S-box-containing protein